MKSIFSSVHKLHDENFYITLVNTVLVTIKMSLVGGIFPHSTLRLNKMTFCDLFLIINVYFVRLILTQTTRAAYCPTVVYLLLLFHVYSDHSDDVLAPQTLFENS